MQSEMMSESLDDVLDNDEAEDETEELTNQACSIYLSLSPKTIPLINLYHALYFSLSRKDDNCYSLLHMHTHMEPFMWELPCRAYLI